MSSRTRWLLTLSVALLATPAWAQPQNGTTNLGSPVTEWPIPLMWGDRDEGFYFGAEAGMWRLNNPLRNQTVARRGFRDLDGSLRGNPAGGVINIFDTATPPNYFTTLFIERGPAGGVYGSGDVAMSTRDVDRDLFQPGARLTLGYRFRNGVALEVSYLGVTKARNNATTGIVPRGFNGDPDNTFLFSDVYNFSPYFAGPLRDVISDVYTPPIPPGIGDGGNLGLGAVPADLQTFGGFVLPAYGITNGAEYYAESFVMGFHTAELNLRVPVLQVEGTRTYWTGGFRYISHLEKFRLQVEDLGFDNAGGTDANVSQPDWALRYTVKQKNMYYGLQTGVGGEAYLFNGFAVSLDAKVGVLAEPSRTTTVLQRLDLESGIGVKRTNNQVNMAAMFEGGAYLWWYAHEGITFRVGYEYLGILGARRLTEPMTYDWGALNVRARNTFLSLDGITAGVSFVF